MNTISMCYATTKGGNAGDFPACGRLSRAWDLPQGRLWPQRDWRLAQNGRQCPCVLSDEKVNVAHETEAISAIALGFGE